MERLLKAAIYLAVFTVCYNVVEGLVSIFFGVDDETLTLFGFGVDSFVEVISGIGILHMIVRMKKSNIERRDRFERRALKITGVSFYLLTVGLVIGSIINIIKNSAPQTTLVGIAVSIISIIIMYFLMQKKKEVGKKLKSDALLADANCTKTCLHLSFVLLASSAAYELLGISYIDIAGSLGIAYFAFREGKESLEKASSETLLCSCHN